MNNSNQSIQAKLISKKKLEWLEDSNGKKITPKYPKGRIDGELLDEFLKYGFMALRVDDDSDFSGKYGLYSIKEHKWYFKPSKSENRYRSMDRNIEPWELLEVLKIEQTIPKADSYKLIVKKWDKIYAQKTCKTFIQAYFWAAIWADRKPYAKFIIDFKHKNTIVKDYSDWHKQPFNRSNNNISSLHYISDYDGIELHLYTRFYQYDKEYEYFPEDEDESAGTLFNKGDIVTIYDDCSFDYNYYDDYKSLCKNNIIRLGEFGYVYDDESWDIDFSYFDDYDENIDCVNLNKDANKDNGVSEYEKDKSEYYEYIKNSVIPLIIIDVPGKKKYNDWENCYTFLYLKKENGRIYSVVKRAHERFFTSFNDPKIDNSKPILFLQEVFSGKRKLPDKQIQYLSKGCEIAKVNNEWIVVGKK